MSEGENPGIQIAPLVTERSRLQREYTNAQREVKEHDFISIDGSYGPYFYLMDNVHSIGKDTEKEPVGSLNQLESMIKDQVLQTLSAKAANNDQTPVVCLDFGGMFGYSWVKIASSPEMKPLVDDGRVAFVVSNMEFDQAALFNQSLPRDMDKRKRRYLEDHLQNVQFIQATAKELADSSITLPNGENYPLNKKIDFIHSNDVIWHLKKPETDVVRLAQVGSDYQTLMLQFGPTHTHSTVESEEIYKARVQANELVEPNLLHDGSVRKQDIPAVSEIPLPPSQYQIYLHKNAPEMKLPPYGQGASDEKRSSTQGGFLNRIFRR